jgi:hypothetical protein
MNDRKTIKINLKQVVEDMIFANACKDSKALKTVKDNFEGIYNYQSGDIRQAISKYLMGNTLVTNDLLLSEYFTNFLNQK